MQGSIKSVRIDSDAWRRVQQMTRLAFTAFVTGSIDKVDYPKNFFGSRP